MEQIAIDLYKAATEKDWDTLDSLLDGVDLSEDRFKIKADDVEVKAQPIIATVTGDDTFTGTLPHITAKGYQLVQQIHNTGNGQISVNPDGSYQYKVTKPSILKVLSSGGTYKIKDSVSLTHKKNIAITSISHQLITRAASHAPVEIVAKLLQSGCCPNSNTKDYTEYGLRVRQIQGLSEGIEDKHKDSDHAKDHERNTSLCCESRPLYNAIRNKRPDIAQALIDHSCPCCGGKGAVVSERLISEAEAMKSTVLGTLKNAIS